MRPLTLLIALLTVPTLAADREPVFRPGPDLLRQLPDSVTIAACSAVATDRDDNLFLLQRGQPAVVVFSTDGKYKSSWGANQFKLAHGLRIDADDNVWTTDVDGHTVRKFSPDGKLLLSLGQEGAPGEDEKHFNRPADVAFAPNGDVFVADGYGNSRVVKFDKSGKYLSAWGKKGTGAGEFNLPHNLRFDSKGNLYVADRENNRVQVFDQGGRFLRMISEARKAGDSQPTLFSPFGLFITPDDTIYISDGRANRILLAKTDGTLVTTFGAPGTGPGEFGLPHGLTVSPMTGTLFVTEVNNKRLQQFTPVK